LGILRGGQQRREKIITFKLGTVAKLTMLGLALISSMIARNCVSIFLKRLCSFGKAPREKIGSKYTYLKNETKRDVTNKNEKAEEKKNTQRSTANSKPITR
jgi:hypothetical protein